MTLTATSQPISGLVADDPMFHPDEPLPVAMNRVNTDLLGAAIADLRSRDLDLGVHEARKKMKRVRGLIRLVRDQVGYSTYRNENVVLRNTARAISPVRDAAAMVDLLARLRSGYEDLLDDDTFVVPLRWLRVRHAKLAAEADDQIRTQAIVNLGSARRRYLAYPLTEILPDDYAGIARGIHRVYRRGRRGFERSADTRDTEHLHDWRKRAKYLRYQMESLAPLNPTLIGATAVELARLGELLGDDHDLAVLVDAISSHPESCPDPRERWLLTALAYERRDVLQAEAFRIGEALYAEKPHQFVDRLSAYWESGRR